MKRARLGKIGIDPLLTKQMALAEKQSTPVSAVFILNEATARRKNLAGLVDKMVGEVRKAVRQDKSQIQVHVMGTLGAFALEAPAVVIRKMIGRKEISAVEANQKEQSLLIT